MIEISLTYAEVLQGAMVGAMRRIRCLKGDWQHNHQPTPEIADWQINIEGALGEMALARWLGVYWRPEVGNTQAQDVGPYEVRTTRYHGGRLILHRSDPGDRVFVLVTGQDGRYKLQGWIVGSEGKRPEFWRDPKGGRPAYFVPQAELQPMEDLPRF